MHKIEFSLRLIAASISVGCVLAGCQRQEAKTERAPAVVSTASAQTISPEAAQQAVYTAVVRPSTQVDATFRASGYVDYIAGSSRADGNHGLLDEGDSVKTGQVLARLRQNDMLARVNEQKAVMEEGRTSRERAKAALQEAELALASARVNFERTSRLFAAESVTKPEFDSAKNNFEMSQARVAQARAQIEAVKAAGARGRAGLQEVMLQLGDCTLRSPITGIVVRRQIEPGALAQQGTAAFTIADAKKVKVEFAVPDVELNRLRVGDSVTVTTNALKDKIFNGKITDISPSADPKSRQFAVRVSLPNPGFELKLGMVAKLKTGEPDTTPEVVVAVPLNAVVSSTSKSGGYAVFVVQEKEGKMVVEERPVRLGEAFGQMISVIDGIKSGEQVVTVGSAYLVSGQEIRVTN